ncbi:MAG TPA: alpha/beta fold hydrolase [Vicinamibacterales bacterium]|nr:alpha/beta fold hydrolase [Vicinamibacterales bacterium]
MASTPWMVLPRRSASARFKLFCLPYAGTGASLFHPWSDKLASTLEVCPIQLPGRENRVTEQSFATLEPLVQTLADVLPPVLDGPYALFGYSMGALVAFELTRELRRRQLRLPSKLLVAAHPAPHLVRRRKPVHHLPESRFIQAIRRLHGTPDAVFEHGELRALMLPLLRADFAVCETYAHEADAPLECPITAFGGHHDHEVNRRELEAWREQTRAEFSLRLIPGGHFFIHTASAMLMGGIHDELAGYTQPTGVLRPW